MKWWAWLRDHTVGRWERAKTGTTATEARERLESSLSALDRTLKDLAREPRTDSRR